MTSLVGTTKRSLTIRFGWRLDDRIRAICTRLNMSQNDVIIDLITAGLDATQDLALREPRPKSES